ncbi:XRE family transcriptional regulator [Streptomyces noursei]|uniref:XRE family transcriptional regulator n=1 Tax=Streptomyces noursei TaxID=1971 RepID=UPI001676B77C|nr:hypothetical protein GCM10010341_91740 [Streptomyces noursei]
MKGALDIDLGSLRKSLGIRQIDQAQHMGVAQSRVSAIEKTALGSLRLSTLCSYLDALGVYAELRIGPPGTVGAAAG